MAYERRLEAKIVGPGKRGQLRVALGLGENRFVTDVSAELIQPSLRMPNAEFVAVVDGRDVVRVESDGRAWLTIQDEVRAVLNRDWDPIGVADIVEDEYDMYIGHIYSLLASDANERSIADYLLWVETDRMGLTGTAADQLVRVAAKIKALKLPRIE